MDRLKYLAGYGPTIQEQARSLIESGSLADWLGNRYGQPHEVRNDRALYEYAVAIKDRYLRKTEPLHKVLYDNRLQVMKHALGTHTAISRVQGSRLKASREIRIASVFREAPAPFLQMIVVHELAHLKERDHGKSFYQLCTHMAPDYHELELGLRLYLTHKDLASTGEPLLPRTVDR
ncbi:MAG: M48 family metallopeptidase [Pseudomonadota bacterium]|nr:M48 family metallopeptidase [Pseudomonadota bacterium]